MKEAEALEILKRDDDDMRKGYFCLNDFTALEVAKNALEKQIAKKLIGGYKCASCGNDVTETYYHIDFCPFCGQKLDWSEV